MNPSELPARAEHADRADDRPAAGAVLRVTDMHEHHAPPSAIRDRRSSAVYDQLVWRLQSPMSDDVAGGFALGLIGSDPKVGVTTIAANLALRAAEQDWGNVLLVETDWRRPQLARTWNLPAEPGAAQLLAGAASLEQCAQSGPVDRLSVITAGSLSRREQPRVDAGAVREFMAEARVDYRLIILDLPAASELRQELALARQVDQALLVVRANDSRRADVQRVARQLQQDAIPLSGAILNRHRNYLPNWLRRRM